jgi:hypothetical protein
MEQRWNDIGRVKLKDSEENPSQRHFVHHKFHMGRPGSVRSGTLTADRPSNGTALTSISLDRVERLVWYNRITA